jgi:DnaJ-class molecular chaperone
MYQRSGRCPDCAEGAFVGNGRCSQCNGTGINTRLDSDEPKCPACDGTGVCGTCRGAGVYPPPQEEETRIRKLFE